MLHHPLPCPPQPNMTSPDQADAEAPTQANTGLRQLSRVWQTELWRNVSEISCWAQPHVERVRGSDGVQFRCAAILSQAAQHIPHGLAVVGGQPAGHAGCCMSSCLLHAFSSKQPHVWYVYLFHPSAAGRVWRWATAWSCGWGKSTGPCRWSRKRRCAEAAQGVLGAAGRPVALHAHILLASLRTPLRPSPLSPPATKHLTGTLARLLP